MSNATASQTSTPTTDPYRSAVDLRLDFYNRCELREQFAWYQPSTDTLTICPLPNDIDNPNSYALPDSTGHYLYLDCQYFQEEDCYNWGELHAYVEQLFRDGWRLLSNQDE